MYTYMSLKRQVLWSAAIGENVSVYVFSTWRWRQYLLTQAEGVIIGTYDMLLMELYEQEKTTSFKCSLPCHAPPPLRLYWPYISTQHVTAIWCCLFGYHGSGCYLQYVWLQSSFARNFAPPAAAARSRHVAHTPKLSTSIATATRPASAPARDPAHVMTSWRSRCRTLTSPAAPSAQVVIAVIRQTIAYICSSIKTLTSPTNRTCKCLA